MVEFPQVGQHIQKGFIGHNEANLLLDHHTHLVTTQCNVTKFSVHLAAMTLKFDYFQ